MASHVFEDLEIAVETYLGQKVGTDAKFIHKLGNFIREDLWKDYSQKDNKIIEIKKEAKFLIESWNSACYKHWLRAASIEGRLDMAILALHNKDFRKNWKQALKDLQSIFQYEFRSDDLRSKITLSFPWFSNVSYDKHNVLAIIEGKYGKPTQKTIRECSIKVVKKINPQERAEAAAYLKSIAGEFLKDEPVKVAPEPVIITDEARKIAEILKQKQKQKIIYAPKIKTSIETLVGEVTMGVPSAEESSGDGIPNFV